MNTIRPCPLRYTRICFVIFGDLTQVVIINICQFSSFVNSVLLNNSVLTQSLMNKLKSGVKKFYLSSKRENQIYSAMWKFLDVCERMVLVP